MRHLCTVERDTANCRAASRTERCSTVRSFSEGIWLDHEPPVVVINHAGKGGKAHWKEGVAAFEMFIEKNTFGSFSQSSLYKSWEMARKDGGVPFFNPYRLRHTYATTHRTGGMNLADVQQLVGHTSAKTTERYAAVATDKLMAAATVLNSVFSKASQNVAKGTVERASNLQKVALD